MKRERNEERRESRELSGKRGEPERGIELRERERESNYGRRE